MRIVFMGTPAFAATCLRQLAPKHEIVCVYTKPDTPKNRGMKLAESEVKQAAKALGIPVRQPVSFRDEAPVAEMPEAAVENLRRQLGKHTGPYAFSVASVEAEPVRFYPASFLNGLRRDLADELLRLAESRPRHSVPHTPRPGAAAHNVSTLDIPNVLLRSRYCIRWELGLCTKKCPAKPGMTDNRHPRLDRGSEPLYLVNQGNRLRLQFDCKHCEMSIVAD